MTEIKATERLEKYRSMRDFSVTAEPAGATTAPPEAAGAPRFVVQRHRARRLHYDVRLEVNGVLASWAVPKGPSLDPARKQLAVHVEDHPIEYFDFEGVIPKGEYGGGDVVVWDWGTWRLTKGDDAGAAIESGELHFDVTGEKLRGHFMLIRRDRDTSGKEQWLIFHKKDEFAVTGWDPGDHPRSVKTGRTNDEVAAAPDALWRSDLPANEASIALDEDARPSWEAPTAEELAALDELKTSGPWVLQGHDLRLTDLETVVIPAPDGGAPVTKRDLLRYYALSAPFVLPYLYDRLVDSVPALMSTVNLGTVELRAGTARPPDLHAPTWAIIDIDPDIDADTTITFADVVLLARLYRTALEHLGVAGMPMVTGRRGIEIWVPITPQYTFAEARAWVAKVSRAVAQTARLDHSQKATDDTLVVPFSVRPAPGAPVAVPIEWDELDDPDLRPDRWTMATVLDRLAERGDPLAPFIGRRQQLPAL
ncbi:MAG: ATP-dependent DNA ligase [Actinomycetota bacterium]|nr:ATP-dependent DNA ligase [Actinomycetota bacterium]